MNISAGYNGINQSLYASLSRSSSYMGGQTSPYKEQEAEAQKKEELKERIEYRPPTLEERKEREEELEKMGLKKKEYDPHDPSCECETCKNRKYKDGSDEMVSFKAAAHISPNAAASRVRAHEQEHVANAYDKAAMKGGKVIQASVSIHTAVCPECGRTYVSGGTTHTQIKYYNEENPYQKDLKAQHYDKLAGANLDYAV
jgi:hypothetical protein